MPIQQGTHERRTSDLRAGYETGSLVKWKIRDVHEELKTLKAIKLIFSSDLFKYIPLIPEERIEIDRLQAGQSG
jgi:hypothetical protein